MSEIVQGCRHTLYIDVCYHIFLSGPVLDRGQWLDNGWIILEGAVAIVQYFLH